MILTAIETKYISATNYRPARIKAWMRCDKGVSIIVSFPPTTGGESGLIAAHAHAMEQLYKRENLDYPQLPRAVAATKTGFIFAHV